MAFPKTHKPVRRKFRSAEELQAARAARRNLSPGRVTAITPQVKRANRFSLYVDDHFALGLSAYVAAQVRVGQALSRAALEQLFHADQLEHAREQALRFLEVRPRSEQELRRQLTKKGYSEDVIAQVLARLGKVRLVDDREFAKFWVENRDGFKPRSKRALQYELRQKGVAADEIARAVNQVDERESAYRAARPKALRWKDLDARTFRQKVSGLLARRGFDYAITRATAQRLWQEVNGNADWNQEWERE